MYSRLKDVLDGKESNYLFPFYWQRGDHTDKIPQQIQRIYDSGCRALCVESRPHPDFCGESWWRDFEIILKECQKRNMKVWLLDDDKFPTGHAAGMIAKKYPDLRKWMLIERHVDVVGPAEQCSVIVSRENEENILLGAYAYKRNPDNKETCSFEYVDLTNNIQNGYLTWDIPDGVYRIFFYYKSRTGGRKEYIDMINSESVRVLIDAVYESHYERFSEYFGNTFAGFFSDEPCLGNHVYGEQRFDFGFYEQRIGKPSLALPWNENVLKMMKNTLGVDPVPHLNLLWYEDDKNGDDQAEIRHTYMDVITRLYSTCFNKQISDWCHEHGVMYIGHVIEDMNCHLCNGVGHYFRALKWQDMSGIDIVLHQVMPGLEDYIHTSTCATGVCDGAFFHYVLGKLGASLSHLVPEMNGRAMCEVFGAYGYGEDSKMMKYLIDHLLVRGINHFVPHAFSSKFPDSDCPPHFGAEGHDPSFEAFSALMSYTNKATHLLYPSVHKASVALLYYAENEWSSRYMNAMTMDSVAKALYDNHIDYDIVPRDFLEDAEVIDGKLRIASESFEALVIPYADHMSKAMTDILMRLEDLGLELIFIQDYPENTSFSSTRSSVEDLAKLLISKGIYDIRVEDGYPHLRAYHCVNENTDIFMFANEDFAKATKTTVKLPVSGEYVRVDLLNDLCVSGYAENGDLELDLLPNQSQIIVFGSNNGFEKEFRLNYEEELTPNFELELAYCDDLAKFEYVGRFDKFFNVNSASFKPDFSGKMVYTFKFDADTDARRVFLDLGKVGQNAELSLNGKYCGIRITDPYMFDVTDCVKSKDNVAKVTVSNTTAQKIRDYFSKFLQLNPSGLLGGMKLRSEK